MALEAFEEPDSSLRCNTLPEKQSSEVFSPHASEEVKYDPGIKSEGGDIQEMIQELHASVAVNPAGRRLTRKAKTITSKTNQQDLKELKGYLFKKSPSFFGGWQVIFSCASNCFDIVTVRGALGQKANLLHPRN